MLEEKSGELSVCGEYCRVHFRVRCAAPLGQTVAVSGSTHRLGYFNADRVVPLVTTPESYPVWYTTTPIVVPRMQLVHYKYAVMQGGKCKAFELRPTARTFMPDDPNTVVEDAFDPATLEVTDTDVEASLLGKISSRAPFDVKTVEDLLAEGLANKRMIIVCYHLPVVVTRTGRADQPFAVEWGESLIAKSDTGSSVASIASTMDTYWLGTVSVPGDKPTPAEQALLEAALKAMNCVPVFLDADTARKMYHGFCKTVMWPILHNVDQLDYIHAAWNVKYATTPSGPGRKASAVGSLLGSNLPPQAPPMLSPTKAGGGPTDPASPTAATATAAAATGEPETVNWNAGCTNDEMYQAFLTVNQVFQRSLVPLVRPDDVVWVHDYHLMMLPRLVRDVSLKVSVVFYMHVPFPTSQIFRSLPAAHELLQSMTCADVVGFHAFDHVRHFLNAAKRMLGIRSRTSQGSGGLISLKMPGSREVIVTMAHVGIEPEQIDRAVNDPEVQAAAEALRAKHAGKKIIVGLDVCQRLSGGALKLAAFEKLLTDYTNAMGSAVLVQRSIRNGSNPDDEATTSADLTKIVASINARYAVEGGGNGNGGGNGGGGGAGGLLVDYEEVARMPPLKARVALWLASDVFLLTPIREGLNLMPLEYIYARQHLGSAGVVVASEFSTVSALLSGALKVNPFYALHVADTLDKALCMPAKECNNRRLRDMTFISTHPSSKWTKGILADLVMLKKQIKIDAAKDSLEDMLALARGGVEPLPVALNLDYISQCYDRAHGAGLSTVGTRVFVFDYGGTLLHKEKQDVYIKQTLSAISGRRPTDAVMRAVRRLSDDPHNAVMVVTGLTKLKLNGIFSDMENVTLATSNGLVYSWGRNMLTAEEWEAQQAARAAWEDRALGEAVAGFEMDLATHAAPSAPGSKPARRQSSANVVRQWVAAGTSAGVVAEEVSISESGRMALITADEEELRGGRRWACLDYDIDWLAVRAIALPIITRFTFRTNGTCMTPRIPGIGWSYFGADPDWSEKQAAQLAMELEASLANFDVKVVSHIQGSIEVVPSQLNKGVLVRYFLRRLVTKRATRLPIFACVIGDEVSDDIMFDALFDVVSETGCPARLTDLRTFTVCVGRRETPADFYVNDVTDVEHLLTKLADSPTTQPEPGLRVAT